MYDRTINGTTYLFGNTSALYESDMVMLDHQTGSYWMQVSGEALVGTLAGTRLTLLPSQTTTWRLWRQQHPNSLVLSRQTGHNRNYDRDPFTNFGQQLNESGRFIFPVSENGSDPRLPPGEVVLGVEVANEQWAYPITRLGDGVINHQIGDTPLVVFSLADGPTGAAYNRQVGEQTLTFIYSNNSIQDEETGSTWNFSGKAIVGTLEGTQLNPLPVRSTFWFSLITSFPNLQLYQP